MTLNAAGVRSVHTPPVHGGLPSELTLPWGPSGPVASSTTWCWVLVSRAATATPAVRGQADGQGLRRRPGVWHSQARQISLVSEGDARAPCGLAY